MLHKKINKRFWMNKRWSYLFHSPMRSYMLWWASSSHISYHREDTWQSAHQWCHYRSLYCTRQQSALRNGFCEPRLKITTLDLCCRPQALHVIAFLKSVKGIRNALIAFLANSIALSSLLSFLVLSSPPDVFVEAGHTIDETEQTNNCSIGQHLCVETQPSEVDADLLSIVLPVVQETHYSRKRPCTCSKCQQHLTFSRFHLFGDHLFKK